MIFKQLRIGALFASLPLGVAAEPALEPADWHFSTTMVSAAYIDHPYMVLLPDGTIVATIVISPSAEGASPDQHIALIRSGDNGFNWSPPVAIESATSPESSWSTPWYDSVNNKLYVFYVYNFEDVREVPNNNGVGSTPRVDTIGKVAFRSSTDGGVTWSARTLITLPAKAIDNRNPFAGTKQLLWLYGQPVFAGGKLYIGFTKMGEVVSENMFVDTEAFILRMDVGPAGLSNFLQLPTAADGIRVPVPFWCCSTPIKITEEPAIVVHDDGVIGVVMRTDRSRLGEAWSTDGGITFFTDWARLLIDGWRTVYHPRSPASIFSLPDGRLFLWTYNTSDSGFNSRNPVWYRIGTRVGNRIQWGPAYALAFYQTLSTRLGYPSMVIVGDVLLIAASDKSKARIMRFNLNDLAP